MDSGLLDVETPDTGSDTGTDSGNDAGTDSAPPPPTTESILNAQGASCLSCAQTNGCLDPAQQGGTCEIVAGNGTHFGSALPDGKTCAAVIGTEPVSETSVCLLTLSQIFSSACAATLQETPCLCGSTDVNQCLAGTATPTGALYDEYACDFNSTSGATINANFTVQTFGSGMANGIVQCAASFGCSCFGQ
jgi:hypothetical protein